MRGFGALKSRCRRAGRQGSAGQRLAMFTRKLIGLIWVALTMQTLLPLRRIFGSLV